MPKTIPGRTAVKGAVLQVHLRAQLEAHPDVRREEHCHLFAQAHGITVSPASSSRVRIALGWTPKKTLRASEQDETARAAWLVHARLDLEGSREVLAFRASAEERMDGWSELSFPTSTSGLVLRHSRLIFSMPLDCLTGALAAEKGTLW